MATAVTTIAPKVMTNVGPTRIGQRLGRGVSASFYITGLEVATKPLIDASVNTAREVRAITDEEADRIERAQYTSAPVLEGTTRDSIVNTPIHHPDGYGRSVGPTHFVARYLVFGTIHMRPQWDFFGASQPGIERWEDRIGKVGP